MRQKSLTVAALALLVSATVLYGQAQHAGETAGKHEKAADHTAWFIDPTLLDLSLLLPPPPAQSSELTRDDLAALHRIETERTPPQTTAAQADDKEQDIFIFRTVLGNGFNAEALPLTAAFSTHIHNDEGVASKPLKTDFARPRPFQVDSTLHPVCALTKEANSYPSGHTLSGYLLAYALIEMVPEKKTEIMARAADYANNRLVCGVHYPSDVEASHMLAYAMFGYMLANPRFQKELAEARVETRQRLGMSTATAHP